MDAESERVVFVDGKTPEHLVIPEKAAGDAYKLTELLMGKLGMRMERNATGKSGAFNVRHSSLNSMHTLLFSIKERSVSGITFWLDKSGKGVTSVSILALHNSGGARNLPEPAINYLESMRRLAGHREAAFMKGPGARKNPQQQSRRH